MYAAEQLQDFFIHPLPGFVCRIFACTAGYVIAMYWMNATVRPLIWREIPGLCAHCGYDLRATPERCPECGRDPDHRESDQRAMSEEQRLKLDYAVPGRRSRVQTMTATISLVFYSAMALVAPVWLVWIKEWDVKTFYLVLAMLFTAFALSECYRSLRILLRSTGE